MLIKQIPNDWKTTEKFARIQNMINNVRAIVRFY